MSTIYVVPDVQVRPGDVLDHLDWIGQDVARRKPDWLVLMGDFADFPSLNRHAEPGSLEKEGARFRADLDAAHDGLARLDRPIAKEQKRLARPWRRRKAKPWKLRKKFLTGNHEHRADDVAMKNPTLQGVVGSDLFEVERWGYERHAFLEPIVIDGVHFAHYWQSPHSARPIGGTADNRLNKLCVSYVCGHEQGLRYANRPLPTGKTIHGLVCGSCYLGVESYRGPQARNEWRGVVVLHDVRDGDFDAMPLTLRYLCREYAGEELPDYLRKRYPERDWSHLE